MANDKRIVWLASYPKSGNTWMRMLLAQYHYNDAPPNINELYKFIPTVSRTQLYTEANGGIQPSDRDFAHLREKVLRMFVQNVGESGFIILKNHNARAIHLNHEIVPRALTQKAIYIVRNPLDIVESFANHAGMTLDETVNLMCARNACLGGSGMNSGLEILTTWSDHVASWAYGDHRYPTLIVRYEDLLALPALYFRNVVSFLGWEVFENLLERAIENSKFEKLKAFEDEHGFIENPGGKEDEKKFFRTGKSNNWQDILSDAQVEKIIDTNGQMMRRLGYLDENMNPVS